MKGVDKYRHSLYSSVSSTDLPIGDIKNFILIVVDSLRQDHVSFYNRGKPVFNGVEACKTPNIDSFARRSIVFTNAYPCGLPTIPVRTELLTGQFTLPHRPWRPLMPSPLDITAAEILAKEGFINGLITDTYHLFKPDMNFHRGFHAFRWIRGQEYDAYVSSPPRRNVGDYVNDNYTEKWRKLVERYLANTDDFESEEDYFPAKVVNEAVDWLEKNRVHSRVFLWIDSFDPHEPWDPPPRYDTYTDPRYSGPRLILPMGGFASDWATEEEIRYIRGLYAGEVSFVDYWLGVLFRKLEELGYFDDSLIIFTADHGHPLADHGKFLKGPDRMYSELLKVPFIVYYPGCEHRVVDALIQFPDVLPTALELLGLGNNAKTMQGRSFTRVLVGEASEHRDAVIIGYHEGEDRCIRTKEWSYIHRPGEQPDELYDLIRDPRETKNLIDECRDVALRLASMFGKYYYRGSLEAVKGIQAKYELSFTGVS